MPLQDWIYLLVSGLWIGGLSGLLGVGGGLMLVPTLVYWAPWLLGHAVMSLPLATGVSAVQGLAGAGAGAWVHWRAGRVEKSYLTVMLPGAMIGALLGGLASKGISSTVLALLFAAVLGTTLWMGWRSYWRRYCCQTTVGDPLMTPADLGEAHPLARHNRVWAVLSSLLVGGLSGLLGIGGAVFLLPLLFDGFGLPVRVAVGTVSAIVWISSLGSVVGKGVSGMIPWEGALVVAVTALIGGWAGAYWQHRLSDKRLRLLHLGLLSLAFLELVRKTLF